MCTVLYAHLIMSCMIICASHRVLPAQIAKQDMDIDGARIEELSSRLLNGLTSQLEHCTLNGDSLDRYPVRASSLPWQRQRQRQRALPFVSFSVCGL